MRKSETGLEIRDPLMVAAMCEMFGIDLDIRGRGYRKPTIIARRTPLDAPARWRRPPRIKATVTQDGTSNVYVPANSSEWTSFGTSGFAAPDHLWLCQEASGNLADSIGSITLTAGGTVTYSNAVTGWTRKSVDTADGGANGFSSTSASLPDCSTTSACLYYVCRMPASAPAAQRTSAFQGSTVNGASVTISATPRFGGNVSGNSQFGTNDPTGTVQPVIAKLDRSNTTYNIYSLQDHVNPTVATINSGKRLALGINPSPNNGYLYACLWQSTNAEGHDDIAVKQLLVDLNWTSILWVVSFTASLSDSLAVGDRLDATESMVVGVSETDSTSEAVAAVSSAVVALSESETTSESIAAGMTIPFDLTESLATADSLDSVMAAVVGTSESESIGESLGADFTYGAPLSETVDIAESVSGTGGLFYYADYPRFTNSITPVQWDWSANTETYIRDTTSNTALSADAAQTTLTASATVEINSMTVELI